MSVNRTDKSPCLGEKKEDRENNSVCNKSADNVYLFRTMGKKISRGGKG
jgi:hypothetical protein